MAPSCAPQLWLYTFYAAGHMSGCFVFTSANGACLSVGARPLHSHISLHPDSRLADAFATYGVPRGISQYMSKKWGRASPRGSTAGTHTKADALSSSDMAAVLREKVVAVSKASHMILLEAVQLRWGPVSINVKL